MFALCFWVWLLASLKSRTRLYKIHILLHFTKTYFQLLFSTQHCIQSMHWCYLLPLSPSIRSFVPNCCYKNGFHSKKFGKFICCSEKGPFSVAEWILTWRFRTVSNSFRFSSNNVTTSSWAFLKYDFNKSLSCRALLLQSNIIYIIHIFDRFCFLHSYSNANCDTHVFTSLVCSIEFNCRFNVSLSSFNCCMINCSEISSRSRSRLIFSMANGCSVFAWPSTLPPPVATVGWISKMPISLRVTCILPICKLIGTLPGDVILIGGRSSINVIFKFSNRISIGNGLDMSSSSAKSLKPVTVLIDSAKDKSLQCTSSLWLNQLKWHTERKPQIKTNAKMVERVASQRLEPYLNTSFLSLMAKSLVMTGTMSSSSKRNRMLGGASWLNCATFHARQRAPNFVCNVFETIRRKSKKNRAKIEMPSRMGGFGHLRCSQRQFSQLDLLVTCKLHYK